MVYQAKRKEAKTRESAAPRDRVKDQAAVAAVGGRTSRRPRTPGRMSRRSYR